MKSQLLSTNYKKTLGDGVPEQASAQPSTAIDSHQPQIPSKSSFPKDVPSHDCQQHHQQHRWVRVAHPSLLARHVRSPLAFLTRSPRPTAQETSPSIEIYSRERDSGCGADGGRRSDAYREGLSLDHHSAAARSGAQEDSDSCEGRGQSVVRE